MNFNPTLIKSILKFALNEILDDVSHLSKIMMSSKGRDKVFALS